MPGIPATYIYITDQVFEDLLARSLNTRVLNERACTFYWARDASMISDEDIH
jgi:hypothetical protein